MTIEMRKSGIDVVGDMPWGTHFCLFYETKEDLLDTVVPYCKAGLESQEFCLWVVAEPVREAEARHALKRAVPNLDRYHTDQSIEIVSAGDWYLQGGTFDLERVIGGWHALLARASARGYAGVRVTGDTAWLEKKDWKDFCEYEEAINVAIANQRMAVLCTYPLAACSAVEILDVVRTHQFAVAKRHSGWDVIETAALKQAKAEIRRLNEELEQRVIERTSQLRRSEAYLAEAQKLSHSASWALNVATREPTHWSEEHSRLLGFDPEGGVPSFDEFLQRIHLDDRAEAAETLERAIRKRTDFEWVFRAVLPDGSVKHIHSVGHPVFNTSGNLVEIVGTNMDVTERKRAEEALRESERKYRHIFQTVGVSIWQEDFSQLKAAIDHLKAQGVRDLRQYLAANPGFVQQAISMVKIVDVNDVTVKLFGAESKDELLVSLHKIFLPETEAVFAGELIAIAEGQTSFESEAHLQTLKGEKLAVLFTVTFPPEPTKLDCVLVSIIDITERKRSQEALDRAQAELAHVNRVSTLGELTGSIAHEVNQPITGVVTNADAALRWLAARPPDLEETRKALGDIINDGKRAGQILSRIRALVKKAPPQNEWLDINQTILEVIALTHSEVQRNGVSLQTQFSSDLPLIPGDRTQIQQVILNLIINAVQAMSAVSEGSRELLIGTGKDAPNGVLVAVRDSGTGLDPQSFDRLFDAFYTTKVDGMGMGLSLCRSIVAAHGGRVWATANVPNGAIFQFTLPGHRESDS
jgi:PAS domain S-box-containing protein